MKVKYFINIFLLLLLAYLPNNQTKESEYYLNFEDSSIDYNSKKLMDNNKTYDIHFESKNVWVTSLVSKKGNNSIGVKLYPDTTRREVKIINIPNNTIKYVAFSVYFPKNYKPPTSWNLFAQWWQGAPASPPLAFEIDPDSASNSDTDNFRMRVITRDGTVDKFNMHTQYVGILEKDQWNDFIIMLKIDDRGENKGILKVWKDNSMIVNYSGNLGYTDLNNHTNFRVGLYRSQEIKTTVEAFYDEIRVGDNLKQVNNK